MSLIQGEKIISTAIGQTWDMTSSSSTCQINNTALILSSYPVKPFSCSWVLWACWLRIRKRAGTKEGAQRWGSQHAEHFENLFIDLCARRRHCRHSASLGADDGYWDPSISEPSVSKLCSPTASGESAPQLLLLWFCCQRFSVVALLLGKPGDAHCSSPGHLQTGKCGLSEWHHCSHFPPPNSLWLMEAELLMLETWLCSCWLRRPGQCFQPSACSCTVNLMCFWSSCNIGGRCLSSRVGSSEAVLLVWGDMRAFPWDTESWDSVLLWAVPTRVEQNHANSSTHFFLPLSPNPSSPFCYPAQKGSELRLQIPEQEKERAARFFQAAHKVAVASSTPGLWVGGTGAAVRRQGRNRQREAGRCKRNCWPAFRWIECCCCSHRGQFVVAAFISDVHQAAATNCLCPGSHLNPLLPPPTPG